MNDAGHPDDDLAARSALEARLLGRRARARPRGGLDPVERQGPLALSPAQHRIWFFDRLVQDPATNNIVQAERLRGPVSLAALAQAVDVIVARHEPLRFRFEVNEGVPRTRPAETAPALSVTRVAGTRREDRDEIARTLADEVASRPFDLTAGPPFRAEAFVLAPDDVVFVHVVHHIAADEWSVRVLQEEIAAAYAAALAGAAPDLPPLRVQYADFAAWQNAGLAEGRWAGAEAHFMDLLARAPTTVALPFARPAPAATGHGPAIRTVTALDPATAERLDALGRAQGATPFMTMLAASLAFLHVAGGQEDVAISSLSAGRARPELDGLVGMFTNNFVLRTVMEPRQSFARFVAPVRDQVLKAIAYQDYPFDALMRRLRPASGTIPFGSVMFTHRHAFPPAIGGEVTSAPVPVAESDAKFDLWFSIIDEGPRRVLRLVADSARYGAADLRELTESYIRFLGAVATAPEAALAGLLGPVRHTDRPAAVPAAPPPSSHCETKTERRLASIWRDVLRADPPDSDTSFFDAGGDSLLLMQFVHRIAEAFGTDLPMIEVFVAPTIRGVARLIDQHGPQTPAALAQEGLLVPLTRLAGSDGPPFYVVSGAGGHVLPFASVARRLEDRWRGVGLLDPAFDETVEAPASIGAVAERLIEGLLRSDPSGPYLLAGYSYGGFVAFEMARRIVAAGGRAGVVILDTRIPAGGVTNALRRRLNGMRSRLRSLVQPAEGTQMPLDRGLHDGRSLREKTRRQVMGEQQRALVSRHRPSRGDVPLVLLRARNSVRERDAADYRWSQVGRVLGIMDTAGDHLTLFKGRNEAEFVLALDRALSLLLDELAVD